ncbi:monocarboxylate transporter 9-like isoform X2 [Condylostylus longicornis]|uniref:monocarboxylate transporter 9-like isoform X2 n=1 Tax=Condylostylus longicornis TaxID=2530218 RepID=UPI00244E2930|nr:monocarboxylate transporter 9-like isoform X2 [Condylostylus longicornis]
MPPNKITGVKKEKQRRDKNDYGENFIAPDGGWGWLVCLAAGISNLSIFPGVQVFGLIYRDKLMSLNFTNSQITTIMNSQNATSSGTGLLNGPMFRRLTFRQVGILGALFVSLGLFLSSFAETFTAYMICYSIIFGFGSGIIVSASSLALNTYFKEKRRRAASFTWTITGTVWLFTGISMHALACALIYQPVKWHTKNTIDQKMPIINEITDDNTNLCRYCQIKLQLSNRKNSKIFSSQLLYSNENSKLTEFEISTSDIAMMARANDGYYGSRSSLNQLKKFGTVKNLQAQFKDEFGNEGSKIYQQEKEIQRSVSSINLGALHCTCNNSRKFIENKVILEDEENQSVEMEDQKTLKWYEKVVAFFDLGLFKDLTFVNLMMGMTLSTFADFNFTVLMPFFLADFGFSKDQIAILMSMIGGSDIVMRFAVPFLVENIKWDNRIFFIIAVSGMTIGRIALAHKPPYGVAIFLFLWIGAFKGLRTIFLALIIPSHVPLKRLPAASGLQLLTSGIFTLSCGPIVGIIRDKTNYTLTLHFLNLISSTTVFSWTIELIYSWYKKRNEQKDTEVPRTEL